MINAVSNTYGQMSNIIVVKIINNTDSLVNNSFNYVQLPYFSHSHYRIQIMCGHLSVMFASLVSVLRVKKNDRPLPLQPYRMQSNEHSDKKAMVWANHFRSIENSSISTISAVDQSKTKMSWHQMMNTVLFMPFFFNSSAATKSPFKDVLMKRK